MKKLSLSSARNTLKDAGLAVQGSLADCQFVPRETAMSWKAKAFEEGRQDGLKIARAKSENPDQKPVDYPDDNDDDPEHNKGDDVPYDGPDKGKRKKTKKAKEPEDTCDDEDETYEEMVAATARAIIEAGCRARGIAPQKQAKPAYPSDADVYDAQARVGLPVRPSARDILNAGCRRRGEKEDFDMHDLPSIDTDLSQMRSEIAALREENRVLAAKLARIEMLQSRRHGGTHGDIVDKAAMPAITIDVGAKSPSIVNPNFVCPDAEQLEALRKTIGRYQPQLLNSDNCAPWHRYVTREEHDAACESNSGPRSSPFSGACARSTSPTPAGFGLRSAIDARPSFAPISPWRRSSPQCSRQAPSGTADYLSTAAASVSPCKRVEVSSWTPRLGARSLRPD